jgi:hypothetical protein
MEKVDVVPACVLQGEHSGRRCFSGWKPALNTAASFLANYMNKHG